MKTVSLDVHREASQMTVVSAQGEVLLEMKVRTDPEQLRGIVGGIEGPKRVVFEEGPLSGRLRDALRDVAEEVISCDPTYNALIACAEDSNDERDARRLAKLARLDALHVVYVPEEPYRKLRSLTVHDDRLGRSITRVKNRIKGLCRRLGVSYRGQGVYQARNRRGVLEKISDAGWRWQMESLYRQLDALRRERVGAHRILRQMTRSMPEVRRLQSIPGVGPITARTLVAWIVDPRRFTGRKALSSYAGLGLGQGWTNWRPTGRARASRRGNRSVKRMLFIAAAAATKGNNALSRRYEGRLASGWETRKAARDLARTILWIACAMWTKQEDYADERVNVPDELIGVGYAKKQR